MNIGPYSLPSQVLLAPMAGTSDKPFRMICRAQGAGLTTSEMVVMQNHLLNSNKSKQKKQRKSNWTNKKVSGIQGTKKKNTQQSKKQTDKNNKISWKQTYSVSKTVKINHQETTKPSKTPRKT